MKTLLALIGLLLGGASAIAATTDETEQTIRTVLHTQAAAWNRGDIPAFMAAYWKSDRLRFASGGTITLGWQPTLDRYLRRYPDRATMGTLAFSELEVSVLAPDAALVFGQWELARAQDRPRGLFTLVLRQLPEGWRIVSDHTSSATE